MSLSADSLHCSGSLICVDKVREVCIGQLSWTTFPSVKKYKQTNKQTNKQTITPSHQKDLHENVCLISRGNVCHKLNFSTSLEDHYRRHHYSEANSNSIRMFLINLKDLAGLCLVGQNPAKLMLLN